MNEAPCHEEDTLLIHGPWREPGDARTDWVWNDVIRRRRRRWCSHRLGMKWCYQEEEDRVQPEQSIWWQTWTSQYPSPPPFHRLARKTLHSVKNKSTIISKELDRMSAIKHELLSISDSSSHLDNFLDSLLVTFCEEGDCLGRPHRSLQKPFPIWVFS